MAIKTLHDEGAWRIVWRRRAPASRNESPVTPQQRESPDREWNEAQPMPETQPQVRAAASEQPRDHSDNRKLHREYEEQRAKPDHRRAPTPPTGN